MKPWTQLLENAMQHTEYDVSMLESILPVKDINELLNFEAEIQEIMKKVETSGFLENEEELEKLVSGVIYHAIENLLHLGRISKMDINYQFCKLLENFHDEYEENKFEDLDKGLEK